MEKFAISIAEAITQLEKEKNQLFTTLMKHSSMNIEYFAPQKIDTQTPHQQDELYVIASGESDFYREDKMIHCIKGDVLFVTAGMKHHFENFTTDFGTWVIFYGPAGGEKT